MNMYLINGESYLLVNEEISKIIKDNKNIVSYDLNESTLEEVLIEAGYLSLFQEEKFIVVKNAKFFGSGKLTDKETSMLENYLEHPNKLSTILFICYEKLDTRKKITKLFKEKYKVISIPSLKPYEIVNKVGEYIRKAGFQIENELVKYIVDNSLNNYDLAINEVNKLMLYYDYPSKISKNQLEEIISKSINTNNFIFIDAVMDGDLEKSLDLLNDLKITKTEPTIIFSLFARDIRLMMQIKSLLDKSKSEYEIMNELGLQEWQLNKYLKKAFPFKINELESLLIKLSNLDLDIKSGKKDKYIALELFILDVCE